MTSTDSTAVTRNSESDGNICVVCFKSVDIFSIGICDHPVCYECSTRMRVLCKQMECPICRQELIKVAFVKEIKPYQLLKLNSFSLEKEAKIYFENPRIRQQFTELLVHECQACTSRPSFTNFVNLKDHLRKEHELFLCDLCVDNLKIFTWERRCYTRSELALHRRKGDTDNTSHRGHPLCNFCDQRYYENDDLFRHLRRDHYFCHFCDADGLNQYYCNYEDLRLHFREAHFLCEEGECKEEKFTRVFRTDIDFRAHRTQVHIQSLGKAAAKQARTLELEFTLAPRPNDSRGRGQRRGPREREKEEPPEEASARPLEAVQVQSTNIRDPQEFPSLTTTEAAAAAAAASQSKGQRGASSNDSMARKLAKGNRFNIHNTDGSQNEEFPSLSAEASQPMKTKSAEPSKRSVHLKVTNKDSRNGVSTSAPSSKANTSNVSIQLTQNYSSASQAPAPAAQARVTRVSSSQNIKVQPSRSVDEFPSLISSQSASGASNSTWVKKEVPKQPLVAKATATVKTNQRPTAADFPVLAPSSSKSPFETSKKAPVKSTSTLTNGNKAATVTIPMADSWSEPTKSKGKKKKNGTKGIDGNETIVFQTPAERKMAEMQIGELKSLSSHMGGSSYDLIGVANGAETRVPITSKVGLVKPSDVGIVNGGGINGGGINGGGVRPKTKTNQTISLSHDNFPSLGRGVPVSNSFFDAPQGKKVVSKTPATPVENATPTRVTFTSSSGRHFPLPVEVTPSAADARYTFLQPPEFAVRNQGLITTITDLLCDQQNRFPQFRTVSAQFRSGKVHPAEYYDKCMDIMGDDCFHAVFPELLVLLPDIEKQQELLKVHRMETRSEINEPYVICATCSQVLAPSDLKHHLASHNLETHFPALSNNSSTSAWATKR